MGEGSSDDVDLLLTNGLENGFRILFRINEGIGGSQLRKEMGV